MKYMTPVLVIVVAASSGFAVEQDLNDYSAYHAREAHPEWYECGNDQECSVAAGVCKTPAAVNIRKTTEVETYWKKSHCDHPATGERQKKIRAICWAGECYLKGTEPITAHEEWFACMANAECVIGMGPCWGEEAVNKKYLTQHDEWRRSQNNAMRCLPPKKQKNPTPICKARRCAMERK